MPRSHLLFRIAVVLITSMCPTWAGAESLVVGPNINMVSGVTWPDGDPFLRQQNEPSVAVSSRNKLHLLAGANDYRSVDIPGLPAGKETGDSWPSYFWSINGGQNWKSTLVPGYPQDTDSTSVLHGYDAGADPVVRAGTHGLFYYSGIVFDRDPEARRSAVYVSRFIDLNNDEGGAPIRFIDTVRVDFDDTGLRFLDKPWIAVDLPRAGAVSKTFTVEQRDGSVVSQTVACGHVYVAYAALTGSGESLRSKIMVSQSSDCGDTWSEPVAVSEPDTLNQGASIAVAPASGDVHLAWRRFQSVQDFLGEPAFACPGGPGEWKKSTDNWPFETIEIGGEDLSKAEAHDLIAKPPRGDGARIVARHLLVAKLNLLAGATFNRALGDAIGAADEWLKRFPPGSRPRGSDKSEGLAIKDELEALTEELLIDEADCVVSNEPTHQTRELSDALITARKPFGGRFGPPVQVSGITPFDQGSSTFSFRSTAYPSLAVDAEGRTYIAISVRGFGAVREDEEAGDARIIMTTSMDGEEWESFYPIDNPEDLPGHQIKPSLRYAGGKLILAWYDFRQDVSGLFERFVADLPEPDRLRHTMDVRVAIAEAGAHPEFTDTSARQSRQATRFPFAVTQSSDTCGEELCLDTTQLQYLVPNLPTHAGGTTPFVGDYVDLGMVQFVSRMSEDGERTWRYAGADDVDAYHLVWTDNRDIVPPADGDWTRYVPLVQFNEDGTSLFDPDQTVDVCTPDVETPPPTGTRNQNIYTTVVTRGLFAAAPGNNRPLGVDTSGEPIQRGFVVHLQNLSDAERTFRLSLPPDIDDTAGSGFLLESSFEQDAHISQIDVIAEPFSSVSRTVFVRSTDADAMVAVDVQEVGGEDLRSRLVLNGDDSAPAPLDDALSSSEVHNPAIFNPAILNPAIMNPAIMNPAIMNPAIFNPAILNPAILNPAIYNPAIFNPAIMNPAIFNPAIFNPAILNPAIYNPAIFNPAIMNPAILNPAIMNPAIYNPAILNPAIMNPAIMNPAIYNPAIMNPAILNPAIMNPAILNPAIMNTAIDPDSHTAEFTFAVRNSGTATTAYDVNLALREQTTGLDFQVLVYRFNLNPAADGCELVQETQQELITNVTSPNLEPRDLFEESLSGPSTASFYLEPRDTVFVTLRVTQDPDAPGGPGDPITAVSADDITGIVISQARNTSDANDPAANPPSVAFAGGAGNFVIQSDPEPLAIPTPDFTYDPDNPVIEVDGTLVDPTFTIVDGSLPDGLTLSADGVLEGTPLTAGTFNITVEVTDGVQVEQFDLTITVESVVDVSQVAKLLPPSSSTTRFFGRAVAIDGDIAVVGTYPNFEQSNAAWVFVRSGGTWTQQARLIASDGAWDDDFGISVALSGTMAVVGAYLDDDNGFHSGSAYLFDLTGATGTIHEKAKLLASDGAPDENFGTAVALSGSMALVGAPSDHDNGANSGSAYLFDLTGATGTVYETAKLLPGDAAAYYYFGISVALSSNKALVGAHSQGTGFGDSAHRPGAAYYFDLNGAMGTVYETAKLLASDGGHRDFFGNAVALSGNGAVVGARLDDDNGDQSGSAYCFDLTGASGTVNETAKLLPSDGATDDIFATSVALNGDLALIGARYDDDNGDRSGSAYLFDLNGVTGTVNETTKLLPIDGAYNDFFGESISISGSTALIGASGNDDKGSAYVFDLGAF